MFYVRAYRGVEVLLNVLLTPAVNGSQWPASRSVRLLPEFMKTKMVEVHSCRGRFAVEGNLVLLREISP